MSAGDDAALGGLAEHLSQPYDRHCAGRDHIGQNLTGSNGGKLVNVADNQQRSMVGDGPQESLHKQDIDHGRLVDDQQVAFEWMIAAPFEASNFRIDLEQPMNGLGFEPGGFRHTLGGAAGWRAEQQVHALGGENTQDGVDDGRLADARPAGDDQDLRRQGQSDGGNLAFGQ